MAKRLRLAILYSLFGLLTASLIPPAKAEAAEPRTPNIVVIMADDLGYGDVSCNGATSLETPNIDRLAREGLRFTSGYCSASTCTPTRYSFLTGTYAFRQKGTGIAPPNSPAIIKPGTETIASLLKKAGYATAVIGKWPPRPGRPRWSRLERRAQTRSARNRLRSLLPASHDQRPRPSGLCRKPPRQESSTRRTRCGSA